MPARQRGLGLMAAIFVITIMAVIVVGLSSLVVTSKESFGYEIMSVRAFLMAESGAQLAINHIFTEAQGTATDCSGIEALPASFGQRFPGCEFEQVSCPLVTIDNADYFTLTSRASCGSGTDQAIRSLTLRVQR
ncbi:MAG: hypothetical protein V7707_03370 [Motiliproteus sp.]